VTGGVKERLCGRYDGFLEEPFQFFLDPPKKAIIIVATDADAYWGRGICCTYLFVCGCFLTSLADGQSADTHQSMPDLAKTGGH
jgi:hypothetical protein